MTVLIEKNDLMKISEILNHNFDSSVNGKRDSEIFNKKIVIYSVVYLFCVCLLIIANTILNKIEVEGGIKILKGIVPSFIVICLMIYIANKNQIKDRSFRANRYNYLLNEFHIYVDLEKKKINLSANKVEITLPVNEDNIKINEETIILLNNNKIIGIIPLNKIKNDEGLLDLLKNIIEVKSYEF